MEKTATVKSVVMIIIATMILAAGAGSSKNVIMELQRTSFRLGACYALYMRDNRLTSDCDTYGDVADKGWALFVAGGIKP